MQLRLPRSSFPANFLHIGTLYTLDWNHDGRFSLDELIGFAQLFEQGQWHALCFYVDGQVAGQVRRSNRLLFVADTAGQRRYTLDEFAAQMQGYCTMELWRGILQVRTLMAGYICGVQIAVARFDWLSHATPPAVGTL